MQLNLKYTHIPIRFWQPPPHSMVFLHSVREIKTSLLFNIVMPENLPSKHNRYQRKNTLLVAFMPFVSPYLQNNSFCLFLVHGEKLSTQNSPSYIWSRGIAAAPQPSWLSSPCAAIHTPILPALEAYLTGRGSQTERSEWPNPHCF